MFQNLSSRLLLLLLFLFLFGVTKLLSGQPVHSSNYDRDNPAEDDSNPLNNSIDLHEKLRLLNETLPALMKNLQKAALRNDSKVVSQMEKLINEMRTNTDTLSKLHNKAESENDIIKTHNLHSDGQLNLAMTSTSGMFIVVVCIVLLVLISVFVIWYFV